MSTPGFSAPAPHRYPPLPAKPLTGMRYIRKHFYAPEVLPLVGVVLASLSMGVYFSQNATKANDVQWVPRTQPWLQTTTDRAHWDGAGGVKEAIQRELRK
ncbi:unnamed protein product [Rhizoctonia solani]|uniref:Uncharacterized protein n=1 Tax=Rhizoctonia solani TaxID=456999 RepID=A0A8H3H7L0_9AGAM|nr:unnamed protein product [Rhizoctonia solani]CAE6492180.1 unnamed protein product [Rhizoctonia solani]